MRTDPKTRERGNTTVLSLGFLALVGLFVVVVVNISAVFLEHGRLVNTVDAAALRAADALDENQYYLGADLATIQLDPVAALAAAREGVGSDTVLTVSVEGNKVLVHAERRVEFRLKPPGFRSSTRVTAESTAVLHVLGPNP